MRRGLWANAKSLIEERELLQYECTDYSRSKTSSKYLAICIYIEFLFAATFSFYAFGEMDDDIECFGQVV